MNKMKDVIIGTINSRSRNNSAIYLPLPEDEDKSLCHNSNEYWYSSSLLGFRCRIAKDSLLGQKIETLVNCKVPSSSVYDMIDLYLIKNHTTVEDFKSLKKFNFKEGHLEGQKYKIDEFNEFLSINNNPDLGI